MSEFDLGAAPSIEPAALATLERGAWIDAGEPVVLLGDSGLAAAEQDDESAT